MTGGICMLLATPWYWTWDGISAVGQWVGGIGTIIAVIVAFWQIQENRKLMTQPQIHVNPMVDEKNTRPILSLKIINPGHIPTIVTSANVVLDSDPTIKAINKHIKRRNRLDNPFYVFAIKKRLLKYEGLKKFVHLKNYKPPLRLLDPQFPKNINSGGSTELTCDLYHVYDYILRNLLTKIAQEKEYQLKEEYIETHAIHIQIYLTRP
jgi:hypothetical protein